MLMPALSQARQQARRIVCVNGQKQMLTAAYMHVGDNDNDFPAHSPTNIPNLNLSKSGIEAAWTNGYLDLNYVGVGILYDEYGIPAEMLYCPSYEDTGPG